MEMPEAEKKRRSKIIQVSAAFYLGVFIFVVILITPVFPISNPGCGCAPYRGGPEFPAMDVDMRQTDEGEMVIMKHLQGDPIELSEYRVVIYSNVDKDQVAVIGDLEGQMAAGEKIKLTPEENHELNELKFNKGDIYGIEIYDKMENKRVYNRENIVIE